ncbi:MAG: hypothetical protein Kow0047_25410 [Anaerolineae bacterium]
MLAYLVRGLVLGLSAAASPGPFQAFLLSETVRLGWRRVLPAALAPLFSDGPIVTLVLLVLTQIPEVGLDALRLAGGAFILYLAWGALRHARRVGDVPEMAQSTARQSLGKAVLMNALNPNPYIFWSLVAGPILLAGWEAAPILGVSFVVGFYGALVGGFAALILAFGAAHRLGRSVQWGLNLVSALALALFGVYQLWQAATALLR